MQQDPIEKKIKKIIIWGVNRKFRFLGFLRKNLKFKNAYFGPFLKTNEKKKDGF